MKNFLKIISLALFVAIPIRCANVIFEDCGSSYEVDSVNIEGCERSVPCHLTLGEQNNITVMYTAGFVSMTLKQEASILINNVQKPVNVTPAACAATTCPVKAYVPSQYDARFDVPTNMALNSRGTLQWVIYNENSGMMICFKVTIQTNSPSFDY